MKTLQHIFILIGTLVALLLFSVDSVAQQCAPPPPPGAAAAGGGGGSDDNPSDCDEDDDDDDDGDEEDTDDDGDDTDWEVNVVRPSDPNDITGPAGFDTLRWVARTETMPYMIRYENSPVFATASAVRVEVICPIDENFDILQFRLGTYGFNGMLFEVPPNTAIFSTQLNLIEEQGIFVDVTAGVNIVTREAFWIFQSIDPLTGLPVTDVDKGFLPVKDTTFVFENDTLGLGIPGDGFANFTIRPAAFTQTRDTVAAFADIVFDDEEVIRTNVEVHTIDALPPSSNIAPLPETSPVENLQLIVQIEDDPEGSGVRDFDLYVSVNTQPYVLFASGLTENVVPFAGEPGSTYRFYTRARDNVLNLEAKNTADVETTISTEPCQLDCNGDPCGEAFTDQCGNCVGGNTGAEPCVADCNGDFGGTAYIDDCGQCVEGNTELLPCNPDCFGVSGGEAIFDDCGVCRLPGDPEFNSTCTDCEGIPNGPYIPGNTCFENGLPGIYDENCACQLLPTSEDCRYFLSNYNTQGGSDIYEYSIDESLKQANLTPIFTTPHRVSLALNEDNGRLFMVHESGNAYQTLNILSNPPTPGPVITRPNSLGTITGATFGPDGLLYVACQQPQVVYQVGFGPITIAAFSGVPITGGDLAFNELGQLIALSQAPERAIHVVQNGPNQLLGYLPDNVSGAARKAGGSFMASRVGSDELILGDSYAADLGVTYQLRLNGNPFTTSDGDLASGCITPAGIAHGDWGDSTPYGSSAEGVLYTQPNPTEGISNVIYRPAGDTRARIEVFDMQGRSIALLMDMEVNAQQEYRLTYDGSHLPNGVYLYRLTTGMDVIVEKWMIAR